MKIILFGASGQFGGAVARLLAPLDDVSAITLVGRNPEALQDLAAELRGKATIRRADITDEAAVTGLIDGHDVVANCTGRYDRFLKPILRGAIAAGADYADISELSAVAEWAFGLDEAARRNGVTAIHGLGSTPGIVSLLAIHAAAALDRTDDLYCGFMVEASAYFPDAEGLKALRAADAISATQETVAVTGSGRLRVTRDGAYGEIDAEAPMTTVTLPSGFTVTAYPLGMSPSLTLPKAIPGLRNAAACMAFLPDGVNRVARAVGTRLATGELDAKAAIFEMFQRVLDQGPDFVALPAGAPRYAQWARANGLTGGKYASSVCVLNKPLGTAASLAAGILALGNGDIAQRGVLPPEAVFEPMPFFQAVSELQYGTRFDDDDIACALRPNEAA